MNETAETAAKPSARTMLLLGATSDIGRAVAAVYAAAGWRIILAGRNRAGCERNARDLETRYGITVPVLDLDIGASDRFASFLDGLPLLPDTVVSVVGLLGNQHRAESESAHAAEVLRTNFEGPALLLGLFANRMAERGSGTLVGVSSVAGERGRASNYVYGSAKAGFTAFLSGLRNRLAGRGVHVLTVNPGYVRTRMTDGMALPNALTASPAAVGAAIYRAAERDKRDVIYVLPIWRLVMLIIRAIPERIFKRLRL
jgi:short-subunit dehydrogenase